MRCRAWSQRYFLPFELVTNQFFDENAVARLGQQGNWKAATKLAYNNAYDAVRFFSLLILSALVILALIYLLVRGGL